MNIGDEVYIEPASDYLPRIFGTIIGFVLNEVRIKDRDSDSTYLVHKNRVRPVF